MRIIDLGNTATDFASDDYIALDGTTNGSRKMAKDALLNVTAHNAIKNRVTKEFDSTRDASNKYNAFEMCLKDGKTYMFTHEHYGVWNTADVQEIPVSLCLFSLTKEITKYKFLDDLNTFTELTGYFLSSSGTTFDTCKVSASGWRSYYKSVNVGEVYHIKATCGQFARLYFFFDKDGKKVAQYTDDADPDTQKQREAYIVIPDGVKTIGVNRKYSGDAIDDPFIVDKYTDELEISIFDVDTDFFVSDRNGFLKKNTFSQDIGLSSIFSMDNSNWTIVEGKFLTSVGTSIATCETTSSSWRYFYKSVSPNEIYYIDSYCGQNARLWFFFDSDGNKVDQYTDSVDPNTQKERTDTITIPDGVATLAVNCRKVDDVFFNTILKKHILAIPYTNVIGNHNDKMYGKTIVFCGDSITYGADMPADGITDKPIVPVFQRSGSSFVQETTGVLMPFGYQIASRHNMIYYNDGISGSTMQDVAGKNGFSKASGRYTTLPDNIDYLVIFFGWNDTAYGTLGTITDSTNQSFYGGYNVVLPYLQNKYPYTKICLVVPFGTDADHRNAIRLLANRWGVSVFDMYGAGTPLYYGKEDNVGVLPSVVTANRAKFQANGAHPNYQGHTQIADMLEQHLMGI